MHRTPGRASMSHGLDRVRQTARTRKQERFTAPLHHVDVELLRSAYGWLRKEASPGVDGVTWDAYGEGLEPRLKDLHDRIHRGAYRAQPSRRVFIAKPDGRQRPLGIAALEDKIVQRALIEVLNAIWEEDFLDFSHGFRPGRGQHDALDARGESKPETFNFLGFTHICGRGRGGGFQLKRKTRRDRMRAAGGGAGGVATTAASADRRTGRLVAPGGGRILRLSRGTDQRGRPGGVQVSRDPRLAARAEAARTERQDHVGEDRHARGSMAPEAAYHPSVA
jgi:hypothetical protein